MNPIDGIARNECRERKKLVTKEADKRDKLATTSKNDYSEYQYHLSTRQIISLPNAAESMAKALRLEQEEEDVEFNKLKMRKRIEYDRRKRLELPQPRWDTPYEVDAPRGIMLPRDSPRGAGSSLCTNSSSEESDPFKVEQKIWQGIEQLIADTCSDESTCSSVLPRHLLRAMAARSLQSSKSSISPMTVEELRNSKSSHEIEMAQYALRTCLDFTSDDDDDDETLPSLLDYVRDPLDISVRRGESYKAIRTAVSPGETLDSFMFTDLLMKDLEANNDPIKVQLLDLFAWTMKVNVDAEERKRYGDEPNTERDRDHVSDDDDGVFGGFQRNQTGVFDRFQKSRNNVANSFQRNSVTHDKHSPAQDNSNSPDTNKSTGTIDRMVRRRDDLLKQREEETEDLRRLTKQVRRLSRSNIEVDKDQLSYDDNEGSGGFQNKESSLFDRFQKSRSNDSHSFQRSSVLHDKCSPAQDNSNSPDTNKSTGTIDRMTRRRDDLLKQRKEETEDLRRLTKQVRRLSRSNIEVDEDHLSDNDDEASDSFRRNEIDVLGRFQNAYGNGSHSFQRTSVLHDESNSSSTEANKSGGTTELIRHRDNLLKQREDETEDLRQLAIKARRLAEEARQIEEHIRQKEEEAGKLGRDAELQSIAEEDEEGHFFIRLRPPLERHQSDPNRRQRERKANRMKDDEELARRLQAEESQRLAFSNNRNFSSAESKISSAPLYVRQKEEEARLRREAELQSIAEEGDEEQLSAFAKHAFVRFKTERRQSDPKRGQQGELNASIKDDEALAKRLQAEESQRLAFSNSSSGFSPAESMLSPLTASTFDGTGLGMTGAIPERPRFTAQRILEQVQHQGPVPSREPSYDSIPSLASNEVECDPKRFGEASTGNLAMGPREKWERIGRYGVAVGGDDDSISPQNLHRASQSGFSPTEGSSCGDAYSSTEVRQGSTYIASDDTISTKSAPPLPTTKIRHDRASSASDESQQSIEPQNLPILFGRSDRHHSLPSPLAKKTEGKKLVIPQWAAFGGRKIAMASNGCDSSLNYSSTTNESSMSRARALPDDPLHGSMQSIGSGLPNSFIARSKISSSSTLQSTSSIVSRTMTVSTKETGKYDNASVFTTEDLPDLQSLSDASSGASSHRHALQPTCIISRAMSVSSKETHGKHDNTSVYTTEDLPDLQSLSDASSAAAWSKAPFISPTKSKSVISLKKSPPLVQLASNRVQPSALLAEEVDFGAFPSPSVKRDYAVESQANKSDGATDLRGHLDSLVKKTISEGIVECDTTTEETNNFGKSEKKNAKKKKSKKKKKAKKKKKKLQSLGKKNSVLSAQGDIFLDDIPPSFFERMTQNQNIAPKRMRMRRKGSSVTEVKSVGSAGDIHMNATQMYEIGDENDQNSVCSYELTIDQLLQLAIRMDDGGHRDVPKEHTWEQNVNSTTPTNAKDPGIGKRFVKGVKKVLKMNKDKPANNNNKMKREGKLDRHLGGPRRVNEVSDHSSYHSSVLDTRTIMQLDESYNQYYAIAR